MLTVIFAVNLGSRLDEEHTDVPAAWERHVNPTKSDAILFGTSQRLKTMSSLSSDKLDDSVIQLSDTVKISELH